MDRSKSHSVAPHGGDVQALETVRRIAQTAGVILPDQVGLRGALAMLQMRAGEDDGLLAKACDLLLSARGKCR